MSKRTPEFHHPIDVSDPERRKHRSGAKFTRPVLKRGNMADSAAGSVGAEMDDPPQDDSNQEFANQDDEWLAGMDPTRDRVVEDWDNLKNQLEELSANLHGAQAARGQLELENEKMADEFSHQINQMDRDHRQTLDRWKMQAEKERSESRTQQEARDQQMVNLQRRLVQMEKESAEAMNRLRHQMAQEAASSHVVAPNLQQRGPPNVHLTSDPVPQSRRGTGDFRQSEPSYVPHPRICQSPKQSMGTESSRHSYIPGEEGNQDSSATSRVHAAQREALEQQIMSLQRKLGEHERDATKPASQWDRAHAPKGLSCMSSPAVRQEEFLPAQQGGWGTDQQTDHHQLMFQSSEGTQTAVPWENSSPRGDDEPRGWRASSEPAPPRFLRTAEGGGTAIPGAGYGDFQDQVNEGLTRGMTYAVRAGLRAEKDRMVYPKVRLDEIDQWADRIEMLFKLDRIVDPVIKFQKVVGLMVPDSENFIDRVGLFPEPQMYGQCIRLLRKEYGKTHAQKIKILSKGVNIRVEKPTAFARRLLILNQQCNMPEDTLKEMLIEQLPPSMKATMMAKEGTLMELAELGDKIAKDMQAPGAVEAVGYNAQERILPPVQNLPPAPPVNPQPNVVQQHHPPQQQAQDGGNNRNSGNNRGRGNFRGANRNRGANNSWGTPANRRTTSPARNAYTVKHGEENTYWDAPGSQRGRGELHIPCQIWSKKFQMRETMQNG